MREAPELTRRHHREAREEQPDRCVDELHTQGRRLTATAARARAELNVSDPDQVAQVLLCFFVGFTHVGSSLSFSPTSSPLTKTSSGVGSSTIGPRKGCSIPSSR